jgi:hypothetical protein
MASILNTFRYEFYHAPGVLPTRAFHTARHRSKLLASLLYNLGERFHLLANGALDPFYGAAAERVTQLKSSSRLLLGILGYFPISMLFSTRRGHRVIVWCGKTVHAIMFHRYSTTPPTNDATTSFFIYAPL